MTIGAFEFAALDAVRATPDNASTPAILARIEAVTGRPPARGALYTTLARLESKGMLRSWMGEATPVRGGKRKRYYRITAQGARALSAWKEELAETWRSLGRTLGELP